MNWAFDDIEREWLGESVIAVPSEDVVAAFDRCERILGREWISQSHSTAVGAPSTLHVVEMGQRLASLKGVAATDELLDKLVKNDPSAVAELHGIHLLRLPGECAVELFPPVAVGERVRKADFRILRANGPWVYMEVTQADMSDGRRRADEVLKTLSSVIESIEKPFDLEVFLRREPTDAETNVVVENVLRFCGVESSGIQELPDGLGKLLLYGAPSGPLVTNNHDEEPRPRLGVARFVGRTGF
jgi:hypothetical protein